jgi:hypothetical protein
MSLIDELNLGGVLKGALGQVEASDAPALTNALLARTQVGDLNGLLGAADHLKRPRSANSRIPQLSERESRSVDVRVPYVAKGRWLCKSASSHRLKAWVSGAEEFDEDDRNRRCLVVGGNRRDGGR